MGPCTLCYYDIKIENSVTADEQILLNCNDRHDNKQSRVLSCHMCHDRLALFNIGITA